MARNVNSKKITHKRGKYSKVGCGECKQRKIKCDEGRPVCQRCLRLGKQCKYPDSEMDAKCSSAFDRRRSRYCMRHTRGIKEAYYQNNANEISREPQNTLASGVRASADTLNEGLLLNLEGIRNTFQKSSALINSDAGAHEGRRSSHFQSPQNYSEKNVFNDNDIPQTNENSNLSDGNCFFADELLNVNRLDTDYYQGINQNDLCLLASDLNSIVHDIVLNSNCDVNSSEINDFNIDKVEYLGTLESLGSAAHDTNLLYDNIPKDFGLDLLKFSKTHERLYLEEFYHDFSNFILPFNSYDSKTLKFYNPARDILLYYASNASFLLAAILAQGAKICFRKNHFPEDENAYCGYLSSCLRLLEPAVVKSNNWKDCDVLTSTIEATLLTILFLTSCDAFDEKEGWRLHLRGAKDLLLKFSSFNCEQINGSSASKTLIFCKFWFISVEILAGLSARRGGTLQSDREMDLILAPGSSLERKVLKEMGILWDNGFMSLCGYHISNIPCLRELIKIINRIRSNRGNVCGIFELLSLLSDLHKQSELVFFIKDGMCKESELNGKDVPEGYFFSNETINEENYIISWTDISHLSYVFASILTILRRVFYISYDSSYVQTITTKLLSLIIFLERNERFSQSISMVLLQWPMLVAGMNCLAEDQRFLLMKYFRLSAQMGSGSANHILKVLSKKWKSHSIGGQVLDDNVADEESADILTY